MWLPEELRELSKLTDIPFQPKWEFVRWTSVSVIGFDKCYESRYKGYVFRYYKESLLSSDYDSGGPPIRVENRLKLFYSRPLNLGLQCYFNVSQNDQFRLRGSENRNLFASTLHSSFSDVKCYAAEKSVAEGLLSESKIIEAFVKLRALAQNLSSGRFVLLDEGLMIFFDEKPDEKMLDAMHQLSTVLTESTLLPSKRAYWTLPLGALVGVLVVLLVITLMIILM